MAAEVYKGEMQLAGWSETHSGGVKVTFWLPDNAALDAFRRLTARKNGIAGQVLAAMIVEADEIEEPAPAEPVSGARFSDQARILRLSSFFRTPEVWRHIGTDKEFLAWLRQQPCVASKHAHSERCEGDIVAAHVRRIANGAGTGIKPEYSAIPLCDHHHKLQHQHGESIIGTRDWWDQQRIRWVSEWAWTALKAKLGHTSWANVNPAELRVWLEVCDLNIHLPVGYHE